jgi:large conductance mechanosensitive channel
MVSMAVGVLIGVGFQGLITSLTENILSPIIGLFVRQNFDYLELNILGTTLRYGAFITVLINFTITAFVVFLIVRAMNKLMAIRKKGEPQNQAAPPPTCLYCLTAVHKDATRCPACTSALKITREGE